ncbi:MAG: hypothetical protein AAF630_14215 [Cyanobacteria bacterium P01_C01_bin.38]
MNVVINVVANVTHHLPNNFAGLKPARRTLNYTTTNYPLPTNNSRT